MQFCPVSTRTSARVRLALALAYTASTNPITAVRTVFCVRAHALAFPPIVSISWVTMARWDESAHGSCRSNPFVIGGAWLMVVTLGSARFAETGRQQAGSDNARTRKRTRAAAARSRWIRLPCNHVPRTSCKGVACLYGTPRLYGYLENTRIPCCSNAAAIV